MSKKRKHVNDATEQPAKVRVVESSQGNHSEQKSRGQSRQSKSERRSKKSKQPGSSSLLAGTKELTANPTELLPTTTTKNDTLANGEDFVSLAADGDQLAKEVQPTKKLKVKSKKKSQKKSSTSDPSSQPATSTPSTRAKPTSNRFILFIGNLPYTTTSATLTSHFSSLQPFTLRHSTDKNTSRSKGFAFIEFENYDKMKTCLKLYHHSIFDPDAVPIAKASENEEESSSYAPQARTQDDKTHPLQRKAGKNARRINVELTAGGGGAKSTSRKSKIEEKNKKLTEQRERRHVKEAAEKAKAAEEKRMRPATGVNAEGQAQVDGEGDGKGGEGDGNRGNIHPSRLKRVPGR